MKKKLAIFNPSIEDGGVEKNLFILSNYISEKNFEITLISADKNKKKKFNKKINFIYPKNINFSNSGRYKKYFYCLLLLIKIILFEKNIHVFSFQANIYAIIVCKIFGIKVVARLNSAPQGWGHNFIKNKIYRFFIKKADGIIVNSKKFQSEVKKRYGVDSICIFNPFDFKKIKKMSKKKVSNVFPKKSLKLINIGRITDQKNQITILQSIKFLREKKINLCLVIVGKGNLESNLREYIKQNNLINNVKLLGYKKNPFPYLKQSDIFILSSKFEGSPNVLVEAMFFKKKIISTDCPTGPREILEGKYGSLFKIGDHKKLSNLILNYKSNVVKISNASKSLKKYDKNLICIKYLNYLKKILNI